MQIHNTENPVQVNTDLITQKNKSKKNSKKILSCITAFLIICFGVTAGTYIFINSDYARQISEQITSEFDLTNRQNSTSDRSVKPDTLSVFSQNELNKLGVIPLPVDFEIQEEYKGIKFVQSPNAKFTPFQINLLEKFIDLTPEKLLNPGPAAIVNFVRSDIQSFREFNPETAAFASGPYVFFNDDSFKPNIPMADDSIDAALNTFIHELTHIAQFNSIANNLTPRDVDVAFGEGLAWTDLVISSELISSFANVTGWEQRTIDNKVDYILPSSINERTTDYGKTKIYEDMADTVAGVVLTSISSFSLERITWAYEFLGENQETIRKNKLPFYSNLEPVKATNLQFDTSKEKNYKDNYEYFTKQVFVTQRTNSITEIFQFYSTELSLRGWTGSFSQTVESNGVIRYKGDFKNEFRDLYIEIYSYDQARGYIVKPQGTIVVVLSGF
jgi:hypothetical protein